MTPDREGLIREGCAAVADNLLDYEKEICSISERNSGSVSEFVHLILSAVKQDAELGIPLAESFGNRLSGIELYRTDGLPVIEENKIQTENTLRYFNTVSMAEICMGISKSAKDYFEEPFGFEGFLYSENEELSPTAHGKVSYFKNVFADQAFSIFAKRIKSPKARYENSFENVCEAVSSGGSEYGILPVENLSGGRLFSFCSMIEKYDLKGVSYCVVTSKNGSERTKFLLLRKNLTVSASENQSVEIELMFSPESDFGLTELLSAAECFGMRPIRVDSLPDADRENGYRTGVLFAGIYESLVGFVLFLLYRRARYSVMGIYSK